MLTPTIVIPAKAGTQEKRLKTESYMRWCAKRNDNFKKYFFCFRFFLDSRFRGNDDWGGGGTI